MEKKENELESEKLCSSFIRSTWCQSPTAGWIIKSNRDLHLLHIIIFVFLSGNLETLECVCSSFGFRPRRNKLMFATACLHIYNDGVRTFGGREQSRRGKFFRKNGINNDFSSAWWGWNWFYQSLRRLLADADGITSVVFLLFNSNFTFPFFSFWQTQNTWTSGIYLNTLLHDNTKRTVEEGGKVFPLFFGT